LCQVTCWKWKGCLALKPSLDPCTELAWKAQTLVGIMRAFHLGKAAGPGTGNRACLNAGRSNCSATLGPAGPA
jgi:hypothetical protein